MHTPHQSVYTTRIVARALALLSGKLRGITLALAFATALFVPNVVQAQCPAAWVPAGVLPQGVNDLNGTNGPVWALAVLPGGDVIAGGVPNRIWGVTASKVARYNPNSGYWYPLGALPQGEGISEYPDQSTVYALAVLPGGDVIVGGSFARTEGELPVSGIARYNPTTGFWSALGSGVSSTDRTVRALAVLPSGDVIVTGSFTSAGGVPANNIASYKPSTGSWSALGSVPNNGTNNYVLSLAVLPGGDVIAGGIFTTAGGVAVNNIARYNPSTGVWSALGTGTNQAVQALAVLPGGDVIVGGRFTTAGGVAVNNIARYNPSTGVWSALGTGTNGTVRALAVLPDGDVVVGGQFISTAGGVAVNNIARYNPSTGVWSALGQGTNYHVYSLLALSTGDVMVGGEFFAAGGVQAVRIARYKFARPAPTITTQPVSATVCSNVPATFSVVPSGTGPFTYQWRFWGEAINTTTNPSAATATLTLTNLSGADEGPYDCVVSTPCGSVTSNAADLTVISCGCENNPSDVAGAGQSIGGDGQLTADDIIVFQNWYFANISNADIAGAGQSIGSDGQFTADDLIVFFNRFFAGC